MSRTEPGVPLLSFKATPPVGALGVSLDRLVESRLLIQANSGGGKSRAIRYLLEQTHGKIQHIVLDREGEFATLRDRYDYALAGPGGETAADVRSAKLLARRALEVGFSLIVDLSEMSLPTQRQYIKAFLDSLNHLPRDLWKDCLIVIDEAHLFAPESGKGDGTALESIALLLSTGRKRGFCAVLATQRIAKLSKDVAAECLNKMIGRTSEEDVKRAAEEIGMPRAEAKSLRALNAGEFWSYGPAIGIDPVLARTGDVHTSPPKRGVLREPAPPTPAAIKRILAELADLPAEAEHAEQSEAERRKKDREKDARIAGLERELAKKAPVIDESAVAQAVERERARVMVVAHQERQGFIDGIGRHVRTLEAFIETLNAQGPWLAEVIDRFKKSLPNQFENYGTAAQSLAAVRASNSPARMVNTPAPSAPTKRGAPVEGVSKGQQKILNALAELEALGFAQTNRVQLGMFAGYNLTGGSGAQHIADLVGLGLVELPDKGAVRLTTAGQAAANPIAAPRSLSELHERVYRKISDGQQRILAHLIAIHPDAISRADLGKEVNYNLTGGSGAQHVADLINAGAAVIPAQGKVAASNFLFPAGLR